MRKFALCALTVAATMFGSANVCADECDNGGGYIGALAGAHFLQDIEGVDFNPGFLGALFGGYKFPIGLRAEGEFAYRHASVDSGHHHGAKANLNFYSLMANGLYDFSVWEDWTPYVGGGIGWLHLSANASVNLGHHGSHSESGSTNQFAYQAIGGISYRICEMTHLGVEYRYFGSKNDINDHGVSLTIKRFF